MSELPEAIARFVVESIDTVGHLEALLLLSEDGARRWSAPELAKRLYVRDDEAQLILQQLVSRQLAERDGEHFRSKADDPALAALLADLKRLYSTHLIPITNIIHAKPRSRVHEFAEAFKLKRGK